MKSRYSLGEGFLERSGEKVPGEEAAKSLWAKGFDGVIGTQKIPEPWAARWEESGKESEVAGNERP